MRKFHIGNKGCDSCNNYDNKFIDGEYHYLCCVDGVGLYDVNTFELAEYPCPDYRCMENWG